MRGGAGRAARCTQSHMRRTSAADRRLESQRKTAIRHLVCDAGTCVIPDQSVLFSRGQKVGLLHRGHRVGSPVLCRKNRQDDRRRRAVGDDLVRHTAGVGNSGEQPAVLRSPPADGKSVDALAPRSSLLGEEAGTADVEGCREWINGRHPPQLVQLRAGGGSQREIAAVAHLGQDARSHVRDGRQPRRLERDAGRRDDHE